MEIPKTSPAGDSTLSPIERIGFDMIRAIVTMRQSSSATAKAIASSEASPATDAISAPIAAVDLLNGRRGQGDSGNAGAFMAINMGTGPAKAGYQ